MYKLVIFDVGGVLRDSSDAIFKGFKLGFEKVGTDFDLDKNLVWKFRGYKSFHNSRNCIEALYTILKHGQNLERLIHREDTEADIVRLINLEDLSGEDQDKINTIHEVYKQYFYSEEAKYLIANYRDARDTTLELHNLGIQQAIFSNATVSSVKRDLETFDLTIFRMIVGAEDGTCEKKPSGEGIRIISEELKIPASDILYVGDTTSDILASRDAGVKVAIVMTGMGIKHDIEKNNPDYIIDNLTDLFKIINN